MSNQTDENMLKAVAEAYSEEVKRTIDEYIEKAQVDFEKDLRLALFKQSELLLNYSFDMCRRGDDLVITIKNQGVKK